MIVCTTFYSYFLILNFLIIFVKEYKDKNNVFTLQNPVTNAMRIYAF